MSRNQSSLNSSSHKRDHPQTPQSPLSVVAEGKSWQQLWGKVILKGYQAHRESEGEKETPASVPPKKSSYLRVFLKLLSKLPRRQKQSFDPKQLQREILEDIGQQLYYARQKQGLTLELISQETRIAVGLLEAIEKGKLEELPEAIYTRSFIKKFADFLGLDGKHLSESFPIDMTSKSNNTARFRFWLPVLQFRPLHLYFLYIVIVILSVQSISNSLKRAALEGVLETFPTPVDVSPSPSQTVKKNINVKVHSKGESNLKVIVDGKVVFEGVLAKETQKTWAADNNITVETSNAGLILVTFNNQKAKRLGRLGEQKKVTYQLTEIAQ
ncbi:MAG: helix-turn-helix domain-containing protein [Crocosphaera sp.]